MPWHGSGKNKDYVLGELPVGDCDCKPCKKARIRNYEREERRKQQQQSRSFGPNNATVNGRPAYVEQSGDRTVVYEDPDHGVGKTVTNDGLNASFVRDDTGKVIVDDNQDDPYEPYQHGKYRS